MLFMRGLNDALANLPASTFLKSMSLALNPGVSALAMLVDRSSIRRAFKSNASHVSRKVC